MLQLLHIELINQTNLVKKKNNRLAVVLMSVI